MPPGAVPFPFGNCKICKDKATGIHYGVATCEGCKGFFKRTTTKGENFKCYFGGQCDINPQNRNRCKSCRFQSCLKMGMSVEFVKMGRIPKAEKEKALKASQNNATIECNEVPDSLQPCSQDNFTARLGVEQDATQVDNQVENVVTKDMIHASQSLHNSQCFGGLQDYNRNDAQNITHNVDIDNFMEDFPNISLNQIEVENGMQNADFGNQNSAYCMSNDRVLDRSTDVQQFQDYSIYSQESSSIHKTNSQSCLQPEEERFLQRRPDDSALSSTSTWSGSSDKTCSTCTDQQTEYSCKEITSFKSSAQNDGLERYDPETAKLIKSTAIRFEKAFNALYMPIYLKRKTVQDYFENKKLMNFTSTDPDEVKGVWSLLINALGQVNNRIVLFCAEVPGFKKLNDSDRQTLSKRAYLEIWLLTGSEFLRGSESYLIIDENLFYSKATMTVIMNEEVVTRMFSVAEKLNSLELSDFEIALLCVVQLTTSDGVELLDKDPVKELHSHYLDILAFTINRNRPVRGSRLLIDLFCLIPKLAEMSRINAKILEKSSVAGPKANCDIDM